MSYEELYLELKSDPDRLQREVAQAAGVNKQDLISDILHQSAIAVSWGYMRCLAERDAKQLKVHLNEEIFPAMKAKAETTLLDSGRKVTEKAKEETARMEPDYVMVRTRLIEADTLASIMRQVCEALLQKKDMLQSLNSRERAEFQAYPRDFVPQMSDPGAMFSDDEEETRSIKTTESLVEDHRDKRPMEEQVADLAGQYREMRRRKREGK